MSIYDEKFIPLWVIRQYFFENCIGRIKYHLESFPEDGTKINNQLIKEVADDELEYLIPNIDDFGCPIEFASKFFEEVDEETIKKAFANVDFSEYSEGAGLLGTSTLIMHLASKCKYINQGDKNILSLLMIANIYITLGLSKEEFLEYTTSPFCTFVNPRKAERVWNLAVNLPKGIVCQNCCQDFKYVDFFNENNAKDEEEAL